MNKRPIRRWGAADEWTFRFQAWLRLGFPGVQGRAGRSHLPERGHRWGQRVLKTPTSPSLRVWLGEVYMVAERWAYTSGPTARPRGTPTSQAPFLSRRARRCPKAAPE